MVDFSKVRGVYHEPIVSESLRKALIKSMRKLDKQIRPSGLETDEDWLFVITILNAAHYLKSNDRDAILKR